MHPILQAVLITVTAGLSLAAIIYVASKINNTASKKDIEKTLVDTKDYTDRAISTHEKTHLSIDEKILDMKKVNEKTYEMVLFLYEVEIKKKLPS